MTYVADIMQGVQIAIAEVGEDATITRTVQTRDPTNPTKLITVKTVYSVRGALMGPVNRFDTTTQTVRTVTQWYTDLLSVRDSDDNVLNTVDSVVWVSQEGDVVTLGDGTKYTLLVNEQPRINGVQCAAFHEVAG